MGRSCGGRQRPRGGHNKHWRLGHRHHFCSGAGDCIYRETARYQVPQLAVRNKPLAELPSKQGNCTYTLQAWATSPGTTRHEISSAGRHQEHLQI